MIFLETERLYRIRLLESRLIWPVNRFEVNMSIRMIASDLYRIQTEVDRLEKRLAKAPFDERPSLENELRKARAERDRLRRALDGVKEPPTYTLGNK